MDQKKEELFFCEECGGLLENKEIFDDDELKDGLYLVCTQCNQKYPNDLNNKKYILIGTIINNKKVKGSVINKEREKRDYIYDITYPRTNKLPCVNKDCPSRKEKDNPEIVLVKKDETQVLTMHCTVCFSQWTS